MRITIQVVCDDAAEAQKVIAKLAAENTWVDQLAPKTVNYGAQNTARIDKIMGSSGEAAEQSGSNDGATGAPRPNISPGEPSIGKIGADSRTGILQMLSASVQPTSKYAEHLKLLWKRGETKYDGKEYYL